MDTPAPTDSADIPVSMTPGTTSSSESEMENRWKFKYAHVKLREVGCEVLGKHSDTFRTLLSILRRFLGVADIANVRFSLPSQLLEPVPNLEYWNYLDRPETFASIGDSNDEICRFLGVLRFWFTKDLKLIKGRPCKPYNSTLGEFFRCSWVIDKTLSPLDPESPMSSKSSLSNAVSEASNISQPVRVSFLTEQTSHHPPVSAFYIDCPEKGISANGYDQISAKFMGTSIKVTPGVHNLGIYITLHNREDESYRLTHPIAYLGGLLSGALAVSVEDVSYITCPKTKIRCILQYLSEPWVGIAKHRVEGVVYRYDEDTENLERIKYIPAKAILATIDGSWTRQLYYTMTGSKRRLLIDLDPLFPVPKTCPAMEEQLPNESRKMWGKVTEAIHAKDYERATQMKHEIEERQREKAAERVEKDIRWKPRFFQDMTERVGQPHLSDEGIKALEGLHAGNYNLDPYQS